MRYVRSCHFRLFIAVIGSFFLQMPARAQQTLSLAGQWGVKLDPGNIGGQQQWYRQSFDRKIQLPGTLDDAGIGNPPTLSADSLVKAVLIHLTRKHAYIGYAWYSREINIPAGWKGRRVELVLERVLWKSRVWIDGRDLGARESLCTPHRYDAGGGLSPGRHLLVIRIDNRRQYDISRDDMAHAYTEGTQIIWNGMIGQLKLVAHNPAHIAGLAAYPSPADHSVSVTATFQNDLTSAVSGRLQLQVRTKDGKLVASRELPVQLKAGESRTEARLVLPHPVDWDEFHPVLYTIRATLETGAARQQDAATATFGMRTLSHRNGLLELNGHRIFLRGTLECCIFPLTGHPPMTRAGWLKVFATARAYGLNHLRFHSWCPPEAAFEVADSMGFYLQVELPLWVKNAGKDPEAARFIEEEAFRISRAYGNHPSFCLWSMGNELDGDFDWLAQMVTRLRQADPRHLYTATTFTFQGGHGKWPEPVDDYYITQYTKKGWIRGQGIFNTYPPDFKTDYGKAIDSLPVPVISHEIGQYSVYPNLKEISKYTGVLEPLNFEAIRNDLERKHLLSLAPAFTRASGKFSANLYKEEIERALKTKGMSGFELLDLHDFPGQGTALVGILDAFWDSKGLVTPAAHRMYCSPVVPLLRFDKACYTNEERFTASAEVANFSDKVFTGISPVWTITNDQGSLLAKGTLPRTRIGTGNGISLGDIHFDLRSIRKASALTIALRLPGTPYQNRWTIWVYPKEVAENKKGVIFAHDLPEAMSYLQEGKTVLLNPDTARIKGVDGRFAPVFWSPVHFPNQPGTMGLLCDPHHPALKNFPTESYSDWQWWDLVTDSKTMIIDSLPSLQPIVRVIDNFFKNRKMADVIEARVAKGKLVLVSMDITHDLDRRPAARQLRYSLERYMDSDLFAPRTTLTEAQLRYLVR